MKTLLGALMCLVLAAAQSFAISGGPVYPTPTPVPGASATVAPITPTPVPGNLKLVGTYAGTLQPRSSTDVNGNPSTCGSNSIGLFSVSVPAA